MPIYEYRCTDCDRSFEALVRPGRDEAHCPSCHGGRLVRELSVFAAGSASGGSADSRAASAVSEAPLRGNVCCGGGCGCR